MSNTFLGGRSPLVTGDTSKSLYVILVKVYLYVILVKVTRMDGAIMVFKIMLQSQQ